MSAVRTIEVTSYRWPGGIGIVPPDAAVPSWRTPEGAEYAFREVIAGASAATVERLAKIHVEAIREVLHVALVEKQTGRRDEARRLIAGASRLCNQLSGPWGPRSRR
jgi:hypothetical protein